MKKSYPSCLMEEVISGFLFMILLVMENCLCVTKATFLIQYLLQFILSHLVITRHNFKESTAL